MDFKHLFISNPWCCLSFLLDILLTVTFDFFDQCIAAMGRAIVTDSGLSGDQFTQGRQSNIYTFCMLIYIV